MDNSGNFHRQNLQHGPAGHRVEPDLAGLLRLCNRRRNRGRDDQQRADAADDGRNAHQREKPRRTAAVDARRRGV